MNSPLEAHEQFIRERLGDPQSLKAEALAWLEGSRRQNTVGVLGPTESIELVRAIYSAGAEQVLAIEIDAYPEGQNTGKLVIRLPADPAARKRVFAWHGQQAKRMGFDTEADIGQSHLFSMLD